MQQSTPLRFHPTTGHPFVGQNPLAAEFRSTTFSGFWIYDPWTGKRREQSDIESDHHGKLIVPDGEPLYASGALLARTDVKMGNLPQVTSPKDLIANRWYVLVHKERKCWEWLKCVNRGTPTAPAMSFADGSRSLWCTDDNNPAMYRYDVYGPVDAPHELLAKLYIKS
jgi:hypothetical protein